uniref:Uncharacterized protein n=1 Tax=Heterorhabditis bacteriophora TaxID=37862 RepID=A0A1I7WUP7_HETBA
MEQIKAVLISYLIFFCLDGSIDNNGQNFLKVDNLTYIVFSCLRLD